MNQAVSIAKALSDPTRLRILMALRGQELCVCEVIALIGLAPSTISKHLSLLHQAGLISSRKLGRWVHFSQAGPGAPAAVAQAIAWAEASLAADPQIVKDRRTIGKERSKLLEQACALKLKK